MTITPRIEAVAKALAAGYGFRTADGNIRIRTEADEHGTVRYVQRGEIFRVYSSVEVAACAVLNHGCLMPIGVRLPE